MSLAARATRSFVLGCLTALLATSACDSGGGRGSSSWVAPGSSNNGGANNPVYTPPAGSTPSDAASHHTTTTCGGSSDCRYWFCDCGSAGLVNSATCDNGYCLDAAASCPDACAAFGGSWTGAAGGGPGSGQSTGDPGGLPDPTTSSCGNFGSAGAACDACTKSACCSAGAACGDNTSCLQLWDCVVPCNGDWDCLDSCEASFPNGIDDFYSLVQCSAAECESECGW